jgi:hypothetical protein
MDEAKKGVQFRRIVLRPPSLVVQWDILNHYTGKFKWNYLKSESWLMDRI